MVRKIGFIEPSLVSRPSGLSGIKATSVRLHFDRTSVAMLEGWYMNATAGTTAGFK